jgi:FAD/FMN-containing dehydrogenase
MTPPWDALQHRLDGGQVLTPAVAGSGTVPSGPASFDTARLGWNSRFDAVRPHAIVRCATAKDVAETIGFAGRYGIELAVRSGGHCFAGHSAGRGVVADVSPMRSVRVDGDVAAIGAGARLGPVYERLEELGRTIPGGTCPSVGVAGLTLGGGLGILGRRYGVTSDRLTAAQVVLASGDVVDCDERRHPDLFWALRGAGPGNFGIVTSLSFRTVPVPASTWTVHATWPAAAAAEIIDAWQHWAPAVHDEVAASLKITAPATANPGATAAASADLYVTGCGTGTDPAITSELISRAGTRPVSVSQQRGPFLAARRFWADLGTDGSQPSTSQPSAVQPDGGPVTEPERPLMYCRSEFFNRPLPRDAISGLLAVFAGEAEPGVSYELDFMPWAGAYGRTSPDATAFVHRDGLFQLKHSAVAEPPGTAGAQNAAHRWVTRSWATTHPYGSGLVFPNFPDPDLDSPADRYYGSNLPRLRQIKQRYDPGGLFRHPQSIPLPGPA